MRTAPNQTMYGKCNQYSSQLQTVLFFLKDNIATASMIANATGVPQKNICRYKRDLEQSGQLWELRKSKCQDTGFKAWYLTTDPSKAPQLPHQLRLF